MGWYRTNQWLLIIWYWVFTHHPEILRLQLQLQGWGIPDPILGDSRPQKNTWSCGKWKWERKSIRHFFNLSRENCSDRRRLNNKEWIIQEVETMHNRRQTTIDPLNIRAEQGNRNIEGNPSKRCLATLQVTGLIRYLYFDAFVSNVVPPQYGRDAKRCCTICFFMEYRGSLKFHWNKTKNKTKEAKIKRFWQV